MRIRHFERVFFSFPNSELKKVRRVVEKYKDLGFKVYDFYKSEKEDEKDELGYYELKKDFIVIDDLNEEAHP